MHPYKSYKLFIHIISLVVSTLFSLDKSCPGWFDQRLREQEFLWNNTICREGKHNLWLSKCLCQRKQTCLKSFGSLIVWYILFKASIFFGCFNIVLELLHICPIGTLRWREKMSIPKNANIASSPIGKRLGLWVLGLFFWCLEEVGKKIFSQMVVNDIGEIEWLILPWDRNP